MKNNAKNIVLPDTVKPGWEIPRKLKDEFTEFCTRMGTLYQEDFAGALFLWPYLPDDLRQEAKLAAKDQSEIPSETWKSLKTQMAHWKITSAEESLTIRFAKAIAYIEDLARKNGAEESSTPDRSQSEEL